MKPTKTSENNPLEVDFIEAETLKAPGRIGLSIAPGKHDEDSGAIWKRDLDADLARIKDEFGVTKIVSLLEDHEFSELNISNYLEKAEVAGLAVKRFPVDDHGKPSSLAEMRDAVRFVNDAVAAGEAVLIHCKGGRGRTGMLAAGCLVEQGYDPAEAIDAVREHRDGALGVQLKRDVVHEYVEFIEGSESEK